MGRYDHIGRYFQYCIKLRGKTYLISLMLNIYWSQTEKQTRRWKSKCFQQTNNVLSYLLGKFHVEAKKDFFKPIHCREFDDISCSRFNLVLPLL